MLTFALLLSLHAPAACPLEVRATLVRALDGDTVDVHTEGAGLDGAESGGGTVRVRIVGVDTAELHDARPEIRFLALAAMGFTQKVLHRSKGLVLRPKSRKANCKFGKDLYGRWLAYVFYRYGRKEKLVNIARSLIRAGLGRPYFGGKRTPYPLPKTSPKVP